jgi:hypothetical protein
MDYVEVKKRVWDIGRDRNPVDSIVPSQRASSG